MRLPWEGVGAPVGRKLLRILKNLALFSLLRVKTNIVLKKKIETGHAGLGKNYPHLCSCPDSTYLQKTYPNSIPSKGANVCSDWSCPLTDRLSTTAERLIKSLHSTLENTQLFVWGLGLLELYGKNNNWNRKSIFSHIAGLAGNPLQLAAVEATSSSCCNLWQLAHIHFPEVVSKCQTGKLFPSHHRSSPVTAWYNYIIIANLKSKTYEI